MSDTNKNIRLEVKLLRWICAQQARQVLLGHSKTQCPKIFKKCKKKEFLAHQLNCSLVISPTWLYFFLKRLYKQNTNYQHHRLATNSINILMDIVVYIVSTYLFCYLGGRQLTQSEVHTNYYLVLCTTAVFLNPDTTTFVGILPP